MNLFKDTPTNTNYLLFIEHISLEEISSDSQDEQSNKMKKKNKKKNASKSVFISFDYFASLTITNN